MNKVGLVSSPHYQEHLTYGHPESPERLSQTLSVLKSSSIMSQLIPIEPKPIEMEYLTLNHSADYIRYVEQFADNGGGNMDVDTIVSPYSYNIALLAAGGIIEGLNAMLEDKINKCFALVRPPGHHAMPGHSMGFCLFNNVAVGAKYLLKHKGFKRIMILDWDVHHGNGTEISFYNTSDVLFVSWHQYPNWPPNSGSISSMGQGEGEGYNINIQLPVGLGDRAYLATFHQIVEPAAQAYKPEIIMVSAGYDAHFKDPLANMNLTVTGYSELARQTGKLADKLCAGRMFCTLEGGYNFDALAYSVLGALTVMTDKDGVVNDPLGKPCYETDESVEYLIEKIKEQQKLLK